MEELLREFVHGLNTPLLVLLIVVSLAVLGKAADWLVDEAVSLSVHWGIPTVVIGATIVSAGTTAPEAAVSVLAAVQGVPDLALGNAVGSIICDTGLILGVACLISPLPLNRRIVNRQGWLQLAAGFLLVAACWNFSAPASVFQTGGTMPQFAGFLFIALLFVYMWMSLRWAKEAPDEASPEETESTGATWLIALRLLAAVAIVVASSYVLVPGVEEAALRASIPASVIAATLVAFGTSLPELVTAVAAARRGHGELAVGNVIGADILNVLFVAGAAAAVTPAGLQADRTFFVATFPAMLAVLVIFRIGIAVSGDALKRPFGGMLVGIWLLVTVMLWQFRG